MKVTGSHRWLISLGVMLSILVVLWALGSALAQEPGAGGEQQPQGELEVAATVNSRISYQGLLTEGGFPVTGGRDMVFVFFNNDACSSVAEYEVGITGVQVTDGLFDVALDVDQSIFWGQGLWLRVVVAGVALGCEEILPVPYALGLRPGAEVVGGVASSSAALEIVQADAGSDAFGLVGSARTTGIYGLGVETGVMGHSYGHVGGRAGVWGESEMGYGVRGTSAHYTAVYGESGATSHPAGRFVNTGTVPGMNQVGLWAGTYYNNVIEGHDVNNQGQSVDRVFRVSVEGEVYADGGYHCGKATGCWFTSDPADFAEVLPTAGDPEPGDVLVVGPDGRLARSTEPYQASVLGVYSTYPMYIGGGKNLGEEGYAPLAVVGLVPVKASAENGPIRPGDLLVASSTPGHAMRAGSDPAVGTVIGKALEALDAGTGLIQMLVVLQ